MHDANLVHGGIKGVGILTTPQPNISDTQQSNILISSGSPPRARLSGFGSISGPYHEHPTSEDSEDSEGSNWRFLAPELIHPSKFGLPNAIPSRETDVYAFGHLVLEVISANYRVTVV